MSYICLLYLWNLVSLCLLGIICLVLTLHFCLLQIGVRVPAIVFLSRRAPVDLGDWGEFQAPGVADFYSVIA